MQLQELPRAVPRAYLRVTLCTAQLPLLAVERLMGHDGEDTWPPALAFDAFAAHSKQVLGSLLGDDELAQQGRLGQTRVAELRDAVRLETEADQARAKAEQSFSERREADGRRHEAADRRAAQRKADAERHRREAESKADADVRERESRARGLDDRRRKEIEKQGRAAKRSEIAKEREELATAKAASSVKRAARSTDDEVRATKAQRRRATKS